MTDDIRRELRLLALTLSIAAAYSAFTVTWIAEEGQLGLLANYKVSGAVSAIWLTAFSFVFCAYALDILIRRRPASPLKVMLSELRAEIGRSDWLIARATIIIVWSCVIIFFSPFKIMIGHMQGFPFDAALAGWDRKLFLGHDAWVVTHKLFGSAEATFLLHIAYNTWFIIMWISAIYLVMRPDLVRLRARYITAILLAWILVGSFAAYLFASAGPCFYERAFGDPIFSPLMDRLNNIDAELRAISPSLGLHALSLQDMLWSSYAMNKGVFGGGISAMPSMHVSIAALMACGAWRLGRKMGWIMSAFAFVIWIGSIHLGWHYALDGIVAAAMTLGIWWFSGWLVERFVFREAPAASLRPALAE